jgi:hypothetical protein
MNGLTILMALTVLAVAWTIRAYHLDLARERRRVERLRATNGRLRERIEFLLDELDDAAVLIELEARHRHPSNVRVLRGVEGLK